MNVSLVCTVIGEHRLRVFREQGAEENIWN